MVDSDLVICLRFKNLLPPLSADEREQLEANIISEGRVRDPIIYWNDGKKNLVIDGMNRYEIARKKGVPFHTEPAIFETMEDVELWMLNNALGRRNLMKPTEIRKVRGELYNRTKRKDGGHGPHKSSEKSQKAECQNDTPVSAANQIASKSGVSESTVKRDGKFVETLEKLTPPLKKVVESANGKVTDHQVKILAKADATTQQEIARSVRTGSTLTDAMQQAGIAAKKTHTCHHSWISDGNGERYCEHCKEDHPDNHKNGKSKAGKEKISAAKLVDGLTRDHVGKMVRGIDSVAAANGGKGPVHAEANEALNTLIACLKKMRAGNQ